MSKIFRKNHKRGRRLVKAIRHRGAERDFHKLAEEYITNEDVQRMQEYIQHGKTTTYEHCVRVAKKSLIINRKYKLGADEDELIAAAMLHDFYLYDWHEKSDDHKWHGYHHASKALENAKAYFGIGPRVSSAIYSHMWPLNLTRIPKNRVAWILCLADKLVSTEETVKRK